MDAIAPAEPRKKRSYMLLLVTLAALGLAYPVLGSGRWGAVVWHFAFWLMLLASVRACAEHRSEFRLTGTLAAAVLLLGVITVAWRTIEPTETTGLLWCLFVLEALALIFLIYTTWLLLVDVMGGYVVNVDKLFGAVCVYILIGLSFAELFMLFEVGAIVFGIDAHEVLAVPGEQATDSAVRKGELLYFSFVTLSTLGYGDFTPVSPWMRLFATVESIMGQLYLTILVARLVGLHLVQNTRS